MIRGLIIGVLWVFSVSAFADASRYDHLIALHAEARGLDFHLVKSVIRAESGFNARIVSRKGAQGLMQLMPATARRFGVNNAFSPDQNIRAGTTYLRWLIDRFNGEVELALAGYNAGEGAVDRHGGIPPYRETRKYIQRIKRFYGDYKGVPMRRLHQQGIAKRESQFREQDIAALAEMLGLVPKKQAVPVRRSLRPKPRSMKPVSFVQAVRPKPLRAANGHRSARLNREYQQAANTQRVHSLTSQLGQHLLAGVTRIRASVIKEGYR